MHMAEKKTSFQFIGRGVYTMAEAGRLTGVPVPNLDRWARGYTTPTRDVKGTLRPSSERVSKSAAASRYWIFGTSWRSASYQPFARKALVGALYVESPRRCTSRSSSLTHLRPNFFGRMDGQFSSS